MITFKSKKFALLTKLGVLPSVIKDLTTMGISLSVGMKEFSFLSPDGKVVANGKLPCSVNSLNDETCDLSAKAQARDILFDAATLAVAVVSNFQYKENIKENDNPPKAVSLPYTVFESKAHQPVHLRDATKMYQRVRGTSEDSVYVMIASGSGVKVAAKCMNDSRISIRVEGNLTPAVISAFANQQITMGASKTYLSGHFTCPDAVRPERVLGAVLVGTGLEFDTPVPSLKYVKELSDE